MIYYKKVVLVLVYLISQYVIFADESKQRDYKEIVKSGVLRVLVTEPDDIKCLPRKVSPIDYEKELLRRLAKKLGVNIEFVFVERFENIIPLLQQGKGDIIAANLTITGERLKIINFSIPLASVKEEIIVKADRTELKSIKNLADKIIVYEKGTSYLDSLKKLKKTYKNVRFKAASAAIDTEELIYKVSLGEVDAVIADSNYVEDFQSYCPDVKVLYTLPQKKYIAWGVRKTSDNLNKIINAFLKKELKKYTNENYLAEFSEIKKRKVLRVITTNNPLDFFIHHGKLMGFEYELAKKFADDNNLQLVMVVPNSWTELFSFLIQGKGDIVASSVSITDKRKKMSGIRFCRPYGKVLELVVGRKNEKIKTLKELKGRTVVVRKGSSYWETLEDERDKYGFKLQAAPAEYEEYKILDEVARGQFDLTVVDDQILKFELGKRKDLKALFKVGKPKYYGWVVRRDNTELRAAVEQFFKKEYKGVFYNLVYKKYYSPSISKKDHKKLCQNNKISLYDHIIKKYAYKYKFPWVFIASQIYQESRFDPKAKSYMGTVGLMQLLPSTAAEVGFKNNYWKPENNVHAGVKYMARLRQKFNDKDDKINKLCFSLASYNGGYGHVLDAIRLAKRLNYDYQKWYNGVEKALALLSEPKYARQARYGCCRSDEIIAYVRDIMTRYQSYRQLLENNN